MSEAYDKTQNSETLTKIIEIDVMQILWFSCLPYLDSIGWISRSYIRFDDVKVSPRLPIPTWASYIHKICDCLTNLAVDEHGSTRMPAAGGAFPGFTYRLLSHARHMQGIHETSPPVWGVHATPRVLSELLLR